MYGHAAFAVSFLFLGLYFFVIPFVYYLIDRKSLRKYPQLSIWSGISDVPFMLEAQKGFRSQKLAELHKEHPVIRIGPNSLSYGTHRAIKDIYGHNTRCTKDIMYDVLSGSHFHLADVVDKVDHQRKRKILSSAYAVKNLEDWEYKVADMTNRMVKAFDTRCTEPLESGRPVEKEDLTIDFWMWANYFAVAAIANIGLSEDLGFLEQGSDLVTSEAPGGAIKKAHFKECLSATAWAQSNLVWSYDWYKSLVKISKLSSVYRKKWKLNADWDGIVLNRATTRLKRYQNGEKLDDFFSALMHDKSGRPHNLEWGEIVAEISIMMNAGSDTTAIAMTNVLYHLLKNPDCLAKLRQEIDDVFDDGSVAPYDRVRNLPYLRACLDESLRITPPNTFGLPRRTPSEGAQILNDWVAGDTSVSMSAWVAHRDEEVFAEPERYIPERWLSESGKDLQQYFVAFSAGARGCIGRNITYLEQYVLLATLVHHFEFALPSPDWQPARRELFTCSPGPMPLKVWKRST
ncbi:cytochrome P450 monooxygenase [Viridothelium virens]|uniref:Cytochrome P450 monooxygenase n=1 Tax=Viridothelium virens TaxID=1048519 RepID=A0A6A6H6T0_VIRVR|nr:cytochrome P450 monooxygenase [Viridothelium virens]